MYYNEDCLIGMNRIPDKSVDMILCDLPYGTTACKWDIIIPFKPLWEQYERVIKGNGAIVLTASQPFTSILTYSNLKLFRYEIIWDKVLHGNPFLAKKQPLKTHENICVFYKTQPTYNPFMIDKNIKNQRPKSKGIYKNANFQTYEAGIFGSRKTKYAEDYNDKIAYPKSIQTFSNGNRIDKLHPTQKPVDLFEYLIKTYTNEGDTVLDNCAGSFTTGIACENLNRKYILFEWEPQPPHNIIFNKGRQRLIDHICSKLI